MDNIIGGFKKILEDNQIFYWLDFGTLLGVIREGNLLSWDKEFDISIFQKDLQKVKQLIPMFIQNGYQPVHIHTDNNLQFQKDGFKFDINIYTREKDFFIHRWNIHKHNLLGIMLDGIIKRLNVLYLKYGSRCIVSKIPSRFFQGFQRHRYMGEVWYIPSDVGGYLCLHYGNWLKPKRNWDFIKDDRSIQKERK